MENPINLFCVVGKTPAVVTETIWALCVDADGDIDVETVERVVVVTTVEGDRRIRAAIPSQLDRMRDAYPEAAARIPTFDSFEFAVPSVDGAPVEDVRSNRDSAAVASLIQDAIAGLTTDEEPRLFVSIAGGRKTMGYYAGVALSLFGRPSDRLSHVLVAPELERPDFYFPTPASDEEVDLHVIPFVRLRDRLNLRRLPSYRDLVESMQDELSGDLRLTIDVRLDTPPAERLTVRGTPLALSPMSAAILITVALANRIGDRPRTADLFDPRELGSALYTVYADLMDRHPDGVTLFDPPDGADRRARNVRENIRKLNRALERELSELDAGRLRVESDGEGYEVGLERDDIEFVGLDHLAGFGALEKFAEF